MMATFDLEFEMESNTLANVLDLGAVPQVLVTAEFEIEDVVQYDTPLGSPKTVGIVKRQVVAVHLETGEDVTAAFRTYCMREFRKHVEENETNLIDQALGFI